MFVPPINLGQFQPSPATLADWIYQIWNYLQNNPIATQEQLQEYIGTFITTSPETQTMIGEGVEQYLTDNPPTAPVQSVQGKTGAVQLAYNDIVTSSNTIPVYKASSTPSTSTLVGQYNLGYRLFVNTATQEIFTISPAGALSLVGRGKFDGTTIDLNTEDGDTSIYESIAELTGIVNTNKNTLDSITPLYDYPLSDWLTALIPHEASTTLDVTPEPWYCPQFYRFDNTTTSRPYNGTGFIISFGSSANYAVQVGFATGQTKIWVRAKTAGTWSTWREI